jgi:hypothetical protein
MGQGLAHQNRAGDRPEEGQRLLVQPAKQDGEQAVDEENAENPGSDFAFRKSAA